MQSENQGVNAVYDALIVGAGPAGALTARQLSRAGMRVAVLEAQESLSRRVCGEYLAPSGVNLLRELGLEPWMALRFRPVLGMKLASPSGRVVETRFPARNGQPSRGYALNRQVLDSGLLECAQRSGTTVRFGFRVRTLERVDSEGGPIWELRNSYSETWQGRILIGADGRKSLVARTLRLTIAQKPPRIALHTFLTPRGSAGQLGEMHILPGGMYVGLNPVEAQSVNASIVCDADQVKTQGGPWGVLRYAFEQSAELRATYHLPSPDAEIRATYPITHQVRDCIGESAALVGDAAGFIDPLTGEGINNALWMARELSAELIRARDDGQLAFPQPYLRRYARRKARYFRHKTWLNRGFQRVIRSPWLTELIGRFLARSAKRADTFIGIVGNVYRPLPGLVALLRSLVV